MAVGKGEGQALTISPYMMRRKFHMRDPYFVTVSRGWASKMAYIECCLCVGAIFALYSICWIPCSTLYDGDDDDSLRITGINITPRIPVAPRMKFAAFALEPFFYKGIGAVLELLAIFCACQGACIATNFNWKFLWCGERDIIKTLVRCSSASVVSSSLALALTVVTLFIKWNYALKNDLKSSLLVMSIYGVMLTILCCLRVSTTYKSHKAFESLKDEIITV